MIAPTPSPAALPPTQAIVQRAYERMRSYSTPPYVVYLTTENGDTHRIAFRASDEMMNDSEYLHEESLPFANIYRAFVGPLSITVHEAVVHASPAPSPGSTPSQAPLAASSPPSEDSSLVSDLKTIAVVSAHARPVYRVRLVRAESMDGHETYRVSLDPTADPVRFPLRDLWIDQKTGDVWRADYVTTDFNFPGATVYLTVNFEPVGPYWIAAGWVAIYHFSGATPPFYRELKILKMRFPATLPDWLFDEHAYDQHRRAHDEDPLAHLFEQTAATSQPH